MRSWDDYKKTMEIEADLWQAAKSNDLYLIATLVAEGSELNAKDVRGYSPLMLAVYSGQREAAELLLSLGADPNSSDFGGNSILMGASFKGHLELVELLIRSGADVNHRNSSGMSAYDFAVTFGRTQVAEYLKDKVESANAPSRVVGFSRILQAWVCSRFSKSNVLRVGER